MPHFVNQCALLSALILTASIAWGQSTAPSGASRQPPACVTGSEYEPILVPNPKSTVTFRCHATPLDLIRGVGRQTRIPIGVILGKNRNALSDLVNSYDLENVDARSALSEALKNTGYALLDDHGVFMVMAPDLTPRQESLLNHRYSDFTCNPNSTLVLLAANLTMWMQASENPAPRGFGVDILSSMNDERFTLEDVSTAATREIANRIVSLGSRGMWIFRALPDQPPAPANDEILVEPYQHYSNRPNVEPTSESLENP